MSRDDYDDPSYGFYEWVATQTHQQHPYVVDLMIRWANTVLDDLDQYLDDEHAVRLSNALTFTARMESFPSTAPHDAVWLSGFRLISSAYQLEKFVRLHMKLHGVDHQIDTHLRTVRNSLEHLEDSLFTDNAAVVHPQGGPRQSIARLPGGRMTMNWTPAYAWKALGMVSLAAIRRRAEELADADPLETALDWSPDPVDYDNDPDDDRYRLHPRQSNELLAALALRAQTP